MKRNLQRIVICFLFLIFWLVGKDAKGQWVTIPDTNFVNWLNANGYASCMNGNLMDTTCNSVVTSTSLDCSNNYNISDLTGIQYFDSLTYLDCSGNDLTFLPDLPNSINYLYCSSNNLDSLPNLPNQLIELGCIFNQLISLPTLPNTITYLRCAVNNLTYLPPLPDSINYLDCSSNNLDSLPNLPNQLITLDCGYNQLTSLPTLPNTIISLRCDNNNLTNLPPLPNSLYWLYCYDNNIVWLPTLPSSLGILECNFNNITVLPLLPSNLLSLKCGSNPLSNLPALPNSLTDLTCFNNQLTSLPSLPSSLYYLECSDNLITSLPSLPDSLNVLDCRNNLIDSLPTLPNIWFEYLLADNNQISVMPPIPSMMQTLGLGHNNLNTLPSIPKTLISLVVSDNQLTSLPELPADSMDLFACDNNPYLNCLPQLKKITWLSFTNTGITCLPNYGSVIHSYPLLSTLPLCDLFNANGCPVYWNISGKVYNDSNNNCIADANELRMSNFKIMLDSGGTLIQQTYTGGEGFYSFDTYTGTYTYTVDTTEIPVLVTCPVSGIQTSVLTTLDSMDYDKNFGVQCKPGFDIGVNTVVSDSGIFRPAHFARVNIMAGDMSNKYGWHCASGISGNVTVIISGPATYIAASNGSLTPVLNGDTLTYSIADFGTINFDSDFSIRVQTDTIATIGSSICFDVSVTPTTSDIYPSNNALQECFSVVSSYDPNEKTVFPINRLHDEKGNLTYTIHFQNTGNAPAEHIYILDTLDAAIDESSFELLAYSHQPQVQIIGNVVRFNFPNINLPDSVNDEPNSHGYVQYRVKLKDSLALGTVISNTSYIYFDFNAPVQTNTVVDTLTDCNNLAAIDVVNPSLCAGDTLILNAALAYPATTDWYVDSVFISSNQNISIPNLSLGNHEIKLVASNAYCNTLVVSNVSVNPLPVVQLGNDTSTCNIPITLDAGVGNISYVWSNGETTQTIVANATANYAVVTTDSNSCSNADTVSITINALPAKPTITQNISLLTSSSSTGNQWLMNGVVIAGAINNTYNVTLTGWYSVMVTDSNGCSNLSDSIYMDLTGVSDVSGSNGLICIVPNPATAEFRVSGLEFKVGDIVTITDAVGKIVYQIKIAQPTSNLKLQTSNYKSGVYFVNVKTGKFSVVLKLVKE